MPVQHSAALDRGFRIQVNREGDPLFYNFDLDVRTAEVNMHFQHFHAFYELYIPLCPRAVHFLNGEPFALQAFDLVCIPPGMLHMTQYPEGDPCRRLIVRFSLPGDAEGLSDEYGLLLSPFRQGTPIYRFDPDIRAQLIRRLSDIAHLSCQADPLRNLRIHLAFLDLLTLLFHSRSQNLYINETAITPTEKKIYALTGYIHAHYAEPLSLEMLAQRFYMSSCYLSHQFRAVTGFTLTEYIHAARLRNVQALLLNTAMPVTDAALSCGFTSFSQFNRVFRKLVGMTPTEYRRQGRNAAATRSAAVPTRE